MSAWSANYDALRRGSVSMQYPNRVYRRHKHNMHVLLEGAPEKLPHSYTHRLFLEFCNI